MAFRGWKRHEQVFGEVLQTEPKKTKKSLLYRKLFFICGMLMWKFDIEVVVKQT